MSLLRPNLADQIMSAAALAFRQELEADLRNKLRPELEAALEHTVREVADRVHSALVAYHDLRDMAYRIEQVVTIKREAT